MAPIVVPIAAVVGDLAARRSKIFLAGLGHALPWTPALSGVAAPGSPLAGLNLPVLTLAGLQFAGPLNLPVPWPPPRGPSQRCVRRKPGKSTARPQPRGVDPRACGQPGSPTTVDQRVGQPEIHQERPIPRCETSVRKCPPDAIRRCACRPTPNTGGSSVRNRAATAAAVSAAAPMFQNALGAPRPEKD